MYKFRTKAREKQTECHRDNIKQAFFRRKRQFLELKKIASLRNAAMTA